MSLFDCGHFRNEKDIWKKHRCILRNLNIEYRPQTFVWSIPTLYKCIMFFLQFMDGYKNIVQLLKKLKHLHHKPIRIECMICSWLLNIKLWNMIEIVLCFSIMIHFLLMEPKIFYNSDTTTWWQRLLDILFYFVNKVCNVLSTVSLRQKSRFHLFVNLKACLP